MVFERKARPLTVTLKVFLFQEEYQKDRSAIKDY